MIISFNWLESQPILHSQNMVKAFVSKKNTIWTEEVSKEALVRSMKTSLLVLLWIGSSSWVPGWTLLLILGDTCLIWSSQGCCGKGVYISNEILYFFNQRSMSVTLIVWLFSCVKQLFLQLGMVLLLVLHRQAAKLSF